MQYALSYRNRTLTKCIMNYDDMSYANKDRFHLVLSGYYENVDNRMTLSILIKRTEDY